MNVTVVGNVNYDIITLPDGRTRTGYGGILYNILVLANILPWPFTVCPVAPVGTRDLRDIERILDPYPNVRLDGLYIQEPGVNRCHLDYRSADERVERLEMNTAPIPFEKVEPFLSCDMVLVNFISGYDLVLETMKRIRQRSSGLILIDVQSMSLSLDDRTRRVRPIPDFDLWVSQGDLVHLSQEDLMAQLGEDIPDFSRSSHELAARILDSGTVRVVMVTLGTHGSYVHAPRDGKVNQWFIPVYQAEVVDTTGCGDAYSTAFACHYLLTADPEAAGHYAARLAARITELPDLESIASVKEEFNLAV